MKQKRIALARDKDLPNSLVAMKRAAQMARDEAIRTGTAIVVMRDSKVVRITADELRKEASNPDLLAVEQALPAPGNKRRSTRRRGIAA